MKEHLVPPAVIDIYNQALASMGNQFHLDNYKLRLEATRDYCEQALKKLNSKR